MAYERIFPECPSTAGGKNPGMSWASNSCAGLPNASTALTQPDPMTNAMSCCAMPVRRAISVAANSAVAIGSLYRS